MWSFDAREARRLRRIWRGSSFYEWLSSLREIGFSDCRIGFKKPLKYLLQIHIITHHPPVGEPQEPESRARRGTFLRKSSVLRF
jgi:hypothetical protein